MLYGVAPPELCLTSRSIIRPPARIEVLGITCGLGTGRSLRRGCDRAPRWPRISSYKEVHGFHVLLGEWLRGLAAMRCDGPLERERSRAFSPFGKPEPARGM